MDLRVRGAQFYRILVWSYFKKMTILLTVALILFEVT